MCNVLLPDPLRRLWQLGVDDDGLLLTTLMSFTSTVPQGPVLQGLAFGNTLTGLGLQGFGFGGLGGDIVQVPGPLNYWRLTADLQGLIVATAELAPKDVIGSFPYIPVTSPNGSNFSITIDPSGFLYSTPSATGAPLPDIIPTQTDVTLSRWPVSTGIFCATCGNASVTVQGDFSCWCCACSGFVLPEDTNMLVVLEE